MPRHGTLVTAMTNLAHRRRHTFADYLDVENMSPYTLAFVSVS